MADSDFIQFETPTGQIIARMQIPRLGWPPPPYVECNEVMFTLRSHSDLTDEDMKTCTNVARGAVYRPTPDNVASAVRETVRLIDEAKRP